MIFTNFRRRNVSSIFVLIAAAVACLTGCVGASTSEQSGDASVASALGIQVEEGQSTFDAISSVIQARRIDLVQTCMLAEGFDFAPPVVQVSNRVGDGGSLDQETYVSRFGFGIAASLDALTDTETESRADPNEELLDAMGDEERLQWRAALETCTDDAARSTDDVFDGLEPLGEGLSEIPLRIAADERVLSAEADWSTCMAEMGFSYPTRERMQRDLESQYLAFLPAPGSSGVGLPVEVTIPDPDEIEKFRQVEIRTAVAWYGCSEDLRKIESQVRSDIETELLSGEQFRQAARDFQARTN